MVPRGNPIVTETVGIFNAHSRPHVPSLSVLSQSVSFKSRLGAKILKYFPNIGKNWANLIGIMNKIFNFPNDVK